MFTGGAADGLVYTTHAHLAELIGLFGPLINGTVESGKRRPDLFTEDGELEQDLDQ